MIWRSNIIQGHRQNLGLRGDKMLCAAFLSLARYKANIGLRGDATLFVFLVSINSTNFLCIAEPEIQSGLAFWIVNLAVLYSEMQRTHSRVWQIKISRLFNTMISADIKNAWIVSSKVFNVKYGTLLRNKKLMISYSVYGFYYHIRNVIAKAVSLIIDKKQNYMYSNKVFREITLGSKTTFRNMIRRISSNLLAKVSFFPLFADIFLCPYEAEFIAFALNGKES